MDVESEQRFHDLEQRYISLKKEHDLVLVDKDALQVKVGTLQGFLDQNAQQLSQAERKVNDHNLELQQRDKLVQDLSSANEELNDRYRRRCDECDRLRDELKAQAAELVTLQTRLKDSQLNLNEFQTSTLPTQYELTKTIHEKNLLVEQVKYLEEEVQKKARDDRAFRAESSGKIHELEVALSQATTQAEEAAKQLASVKDANDNQAEKINVYLGQLRESERGAIEKQAAFSSELESLKRLVDLYKRYFEDATAKVADLEQHEEVMRETHANVLKTLRDKVTQQLTDSEQAAAKERTAWEAKVKDLEAQLAAAQEAVTSRSVVAFVEGGSASSAITSAHADTAGSVLAIENFDGIGITELYDRVVQTEKDLYAERSKRREVELYMQQILKDVESKAPVIAAQRRDYHRVVESHAALTRRLDALVSENAELKATLRNMRRHTQEAEEEAAVLAEHNADLGRQVQNLLKRSLGVEFGSGSGPSHAAQVESDTPSGVISEYLVTFDTIEELQVRNAELLRVVRKLSKDQEQSQQAQARITESGEDSMDVDGPFSARSPGAASSNNTAALQAALEELGKMREARQRTEEMVSVLTQQRDMYRSMAEGDTSVFRVSSPAAKSPGAGLFGAATPAAGSSTSNDIEVADNLWNSAAVRELQSKLSQAEDDRRRIQERLTRFEEAEQLLNEALDKVRKEATTARLEAAQGTSEARFQRERAERLETTLQSTQQESASALQRRLEMERTLLEASKEVRAREDRIAELYEQLRVSQDSQRRSEIEAEVARASETRLIAQIAEAREETRRHVSLVEHINRIESGLQSRAEAEKEALVAENESLKASFDTLRKQLDDRTLLDEQRAKVAEEEIRSIRSRLEQKTAEYASISEQLAREQITAQAAQERAALLEKQLALAQERLTHSQGSQIIETSMASDYTAKELALERAQAEIAALREQVTNTEVHAEQFRKISAVNESALKDLRAKAAAAQAAQETEVAKMREELEAAQKDVQDNRAHSQGLLQEAEDAREQLRTLTAESGDSVRKLEEALALLRQECEQLKTQSASVSGEITRFQDAARAAHQNYERELQLHATAERELSELRRQLEETRQVLQQEQQRTAQLSADCIRKETQLVEERSKSQQENKDLNEHVKGLQYTNDLLHTQVQSYGLQIERLQEQRMFHAGLSSAVAPTPAAAAAVTGPEAATMSEDGTSSAQGTSVLDQATQELTSQEDALNASTQPLPTTAATTTTAAATAADSDAPYDEMSELRKSTSEMREVLRYMKREKDMLQAKLSVSETENARLASELQSLRRTLDEVRSELKRELDKRTPLRNAEEFNALMAEVNQLNLYRESNQHMRAENEDLSKRLAAASAALAEAKDAAAPLDDTIRKLRAEKESLDMVNDQLTNDVSYWRSRLQSLISRYNDVDPEEHRLLKTKLDEVTAQLAVAQQALEAQRMLTDSAAAEAATAAESKDKEIAALKAQVAGVETTANKLRDTLRTFKERYEALRTNLKDSEAKLAAEKQSSAALESQIAEAKAQVDTLTASLASVSAAKAEIEAQLKAGGTAGTASAAGAATGAAPAAAGGPTPARRKRPAPGTSPTGAAPPVPTTASVPATTATTAAPVPAAVTVPATVAASTAPAAPATEVAPSVAAAPATSAAPAATSATPVVTAAAAASGPVDRAARMKENLMRKKAAAEKAAAEKAAAAVTTTSDAPAPNTSAAAPTVAAPAPTTPAVAAVPVPAPATASAVTAVSNAPAVSVPVPAAAEAPAATTLGKRPAEQQLTKNSDIYVIGVAGKGDNPRIPIDFPPVKSRTPPNLKAQAFLRAQMAIPFGTPDPTPTNSEEAAAVLAEYCSGLVDPSAQAAGASQEEAHTVDMSADQDVVDLVSSNESAEAGEITEDAPTAEPAPSAPVVTEKEEEAVKTPAKLGSGNPFAFGGASTGSGVFGSGANVSMFRPALAVLSGSTDSASNTSATATSPPATTPKSIFGGAAASGPFSAPAGGALFGSAFASGATPTSNTAPVNNPWGGKSLNPTASSFAPAATVGFGSFGGASASPAPGASIFGQAAKSPFGATTSATPSAPSTSLWGSANAPKTGILKSTSSTAAAPAAVAPMAAVVSAPVGAVETASEAPATSTVAILAPAPTSGPEYQKRIEARAARFAAQAPPPAYPLPTPAKIFFPPAELPPVEEEFVEEEDVYNERGGNNNEGNGNDSQDDDGAWDDNQADNGDSGDLEDGEV